MKSGIRSIGESAYPTVIAASIFACNGVSLLLSAMAIAGISVFHLFDSVGMQ